MSIITSKGKWIAFAPKAGLTTMYQYVDAGLAEHTRTHLYTASSTVIICRDPLLRAISIYYYNCITMPYNNHYNHAIAAANGGDYNPLYDQIRLVYPQPSELPVDAERFLYWIDQVLPNTIHTDRHTMSQTDHWKLPDCATWQQVNVEWWRLQDLNHHLQAEFGWVPQLQNRQAYHRSRSLKLLELEGVRDSIYKYYAEDFAAYETAQQHNRSR